jgi:hypothetical protein
MRCVVTISAIFIDGIKFKRGDVVDVDDPNIYGTKLEQIAELEPVSDIIVKAKPGRRKKVVDEDI